MNSSYDWRQKITINPPFDQGNCDSCTSFAIAAAIEANWLIANSGKGPISVSAGYFHTCLANAGETDVDVICGNPEPLSTLLAKVKEKGYVLLSHGDYPFPPSSCSTVAVFGQIDFKPINDVNSAKIQIINGGPILADMYIWDDFNNYQTTPETPSYLPDMTKGGPSIHSVCVVGFNVDGWIIKNSFGHQWGDGNGYATISYNACGLIGSNPPIGYPPRQTFSLNC